MLDRREFLKQAGVGTLATLGALHPARAAFAGGRPAGAGSAYDGPFVILVRFGGGVRRRETIDPDHTWSPYLLNELVPRGTLYPHMEIDWFTQAEGEKQDVETSHGQGTLHLLTGRYNGFANRSDAAFTEDFEPTVPTVFEYLRKQYDVPRHQTLIINHEDRLSEEFYTSSTHHQYGIRYRSEVLSLYRFKLFLLEQARREGRGDDVRKMLKDVERKALELQEQSPERKLVSGPEIEALWQAWQHDYGDSGLVNPRGDRVLTEIAVRAIRHLRPRLMMINYNDPDYVHWGNPNHYTRGIAIIDRGLRRLVETVEADEVYRDRTVFVVVPDCGRDNNRLMSVPYQHHFNSRSAREIWALLFGTGVQRGARVDRVVQQVEVAKTVGQLMGFQASHADGAVLEEAIA